MCPVFCDTCYNETTCKICKSGPNRLGLPDNCQCEPGYFENNGVCSSNFIYLMNIYIHKYLIKYY